jgi:predicted secreted protein
MRTFLYLCAVLGLIFCFSPRSFAGEYADLKFIGFSKDGKYMAFEEWGTYDGSGADFSTTYFIDTVKNSYALPPVEITEGEGYTAAEKRIEAARNKKLRLTLSNNLRRLKIVAGNTGELILAHLLTDFSDRDANVSPVEDTETVKFTNYIFVNNPGDQGHYELTLKNIPAVGEQPCDNTESKMLELSILNKISSEVFEPQIMQKDTILPKSRWCPYYYRIERVYFYEDKIAVFLNYFNQGFEGRSMRYLAVTARLNERPLDKY